MVILEADHQDLWPELLGELLGMIQAGRGWQQGLDYSRQQLRTIYLVVWAEMAHLGRSPQKLSSSAICLVGWHPHLYLICPMKVLSMLWHLCREGESYTRKGRAWIFLCWNKCSLSVSLQRQNHSLLLLADTSNKNPTRFFLILFSREPEWGTFKP